MAEEVFGSREYMKKLIKNPISFWIKTIFVNTYYEWKNFGKEIRIGYLSRIVNVSFQKNNTIGDNTDLTNVAIGEFSYIAGNSSVSNALIGNFCSIGDKVKIGGGRHPLAFISTHPFTYPLKNSGENGFKEVLPVIIGNDVWIGSSVTILDGVKIGDGAIIGAGAVVVKDVPPFSINGGVPSKTIRYRFNEEQIKKLEKIKWWDRGEDWILKNKTIFLDIEKFIKEIAND